MACVDANLGCFGQTCGSQLQRVKVNPRTAYWDLEEQMQRGSDWEPDA